MSKHAMTKSDRRQVERKMTRPRDAKVPQAKAVPADKPAAQDRRDRRREECPANACHASKRRELPCGQAYLQSGWVREACPRARVLSRSLPYGPADLQSARLHEAFSRIRLLSCSLLQMEGAW